MNPHDDLEAYVLGALDADDARAFDAHLAACPACREGIGSYGPVMRALRGLPVASPPPAPSPHARRGRVWWSTAVAAAAIAGLVAGNRTASGAGTNGDLDALASVVANAGTQVALRGSVAHGVAIRGAAGTAFVVDGLPAPPAGRGYQVWVRGASVRSPGMLRRTGDGHELLVVPGDALSGAQHIGITDEPAGGSPKRTGTPQVTGDVAALDGGGDSPVALR